MRVQADTCRDMDSDVSETAVNASRY